MNPAHVRTFLSIVPPPAAREALAGVSRCLAESRAGVRWERPEQYHITLRFLGDVPAGLVGEIAGAVERAASPFAAFPLAYAGVGAFPDARRPRVVWAGCEDPDGSLGRLKAAVDDALRDFVAAGPPLEKEEFHPHVTLGRVREGGHYLTSFLEKCTFEPQRTVADGIFVMKSMLTPQGALHSVIRSIHLHSL